ARGEPPIIGRHELGEFCDDLMKWQAAVLVAFGYRADRVRKVVDVAPVDTGDLRDTEPLKPANEDHCTGAPVCATCEHRDDLLMSERSRSTTVNLNWRQLLCRVVVDITIPYGELVKSSQRSAFGARGAGRDSIAPNM